MQFLTRIFHGKFHKFDEDLSPNTIKPGFNDAAKSRCVFNHLKNRMSSSILLRPVDLCVEKIRANIFLPVTKIS